MVSLVPKQRWLFFGFVLILLTYGYLAFATPPGADVLWRLHIAQAILDGQVLYRDVIEVNPPLWFWSAIPLVAMGGYPALVLVNFFLGLGTLYLFFKLAGLTQAPARVRAATIGLAVGLFVACALEIGQREQSFLAACALWSAILAARMDGKSIPLLPLILASCLCGYGFALKHYFVIVPIATELLLLWILRRQWRPVRPETLILGSLALAYSIAFVLASPVFFDEVLDLIALTYDGFSPMNRLSVPERWIAMFRRVSFALVPIFFWISARKADSITKMLLVCLAGSVVVVFWQQKGWDYHVFAMTGLSITLTLMFCADLWGRFRASKQRADVAYAGVGLGLIGFILLGPILFHLKNNGQVVRHDIQAFVDKEPRSNDIAILSISPESAFLPLARQGRPFWSRYFSMWMMESLLEPRSDPANEASRRVELSKAFAAFEKDLKCLSPHAIMADYQARAPKNGVACDTLCMLRKSPSLRQWLDTHYRKTSEPFGSQVWRLKDKRPAKPGSCPAQ